VQNFKVRKREIRTRRHRLKERNKEKRQKDLVESMGVVKERQE